jgi:hypothetical protein
MYVYPDPDTNTLYLITIGDKGSQREDNATCREFIVSLREEKQKAHDAQYPKPETTSSPDDSDEQRDPN